jgi:hypothetical protein
MKPKLSLTIIVLQQLCFIVQLLTTFVFQLQTVAFISMCFVFGFAVLWIVCKFNNSITRFFQRTLNKIWK